LHHLAVDAVISFAPGENVWQSDANCAGASSTWPSSFPIPTGPRLRLLWQASPARRCRPDRTQLAADRSGAGAIREVRMRKRSEADVQRALAAAASPARPPALQAHHVYQYLHLVARSAATRNPSAPQLTLTETELADAATFLDTAPPPPRSGSG